MRNAIVFVVLIMLFACELIVDVDVPFPQAKLTLNAVFNADSLWTAQIKQNRHILDEAPYQEVSGAAVIIFKDGAPIDTLSDQGNGVYQSDTGKPEAGQTYSIEAKVDNFETVTGTSAAPVGVQLK